MQQGIKKLQWFEYFKVVFLEILNAGLCRVFANQVVTSIQTYKQASKKTDFTVDLTWWGSPQLLHFLASYLLVSLKPLKDDCHHM